MVETMFLMPSDSPMSRGCGVSRSALKASTRSSSRPTSVCERRNFMAAWSVASSLSFSQGFDTKSVAPALMACTALSVSA